MLDIGLHFLRAASLASNARRADALSCDQPALFVGPQRACWQVGATEQSCHGLDLVLEFAARWCCASRGQLPELGDKQSLGADLLNWLWPSDSAIR